MSSEALFDFVDIDHYVMPTLHLMLGIVNYLYKNMVEEARADCEGYSLDYVEAERIWELSKYDAATAKTNKKSCYKWTIRKATEEGSKGRGRQEATTFYGSRVGIIGGGAQPADIGDKKVKGELRERRRMFEEEAAKSENSKVEGHTVRAGMESVMKDNGIEFGAFRAGDIQGNGCRKLMSCGG